MVYLYISFADSCELLDLEWFTYHMKKLSKDFRIDSVDLSGNQSGCDQACLDMYTEPVCHSYDYNNSTNNCTLMSFDYIAMATPLSESAEDMHREWQCHNG